MKTIVLNGKNMTMASTARPEMIRKRENSSRNLKAFTKVLKIVNLAKKPVLPGVKLHPEFFH